MTLPRPPRRRTYGLPILALAFGFAVAGPAAAQVPAPMLGSWTVTWQTDKRAYEAAMTVTETGGTWQTATLDPRNTCAGREVPMKIESASGTTVRFSLRFSEVIAGCPNVNVVLDASADGTVSGRRSNFELTLNRR